ncbi:hypothetical protein B0H21DRAFT_856268 [Amylocystis lapponica]|nr:hypothetical protein B0H21DRAFT_856268 [Amylocystis lapponica]
MSAMERPGRTWTGTGWDYLQLRTPSPSVESTSVALGPPQSPSPAARLARLSVDERARQLSPTRPGQPRSIAPDLVPDLPLPEVSADALASRIAAIPAKTVHAYVLSRLPNTPPHVLPALGTFFADLAPPPRLHCMRCHKDFVDVENDDRSCLVPHDDESAEVERVGRLANARARAPGVGGATYETLWGCCGKVVEGDGDQGPPDGWCYEGKHTTDIKRARFRADSTPQNDKLTSCLRLNCHGVRDRMPRASTRKRARPVNLKEPDTDEDQSEGDADSGMEQIVRDAKGKGRAQDAASDNEKMDVDRTDADSASRAGSARGKAKTATALGAPKRRGRPSKAKPAPRDADGDDADDAASVKSAPVGPKRRGRKVKSKAFVDSSDIEVEGGTRTRSQSPKKLDNSAAKARARPRKGVDAQGKHDSDNDADEDKPKKKRKVVA